MDFKDLSPEDQQAIIDRVKRARLETPALLKEGRYADAFDLVYYAALTDPESLRLAVDIAQQVEGIHLLRPDQIEILRQHADKQLPLAQYLYAFWLWFNRKNAADISRVIELMEKASKWGIGDASFCLSRIYALGEAFEVNQEKSDYYYKLAGKQEMNFKWFCRKIRDHIYGRNGEQEDPQITITILRDIIGLPKDTDLRWQEERVKESQTEAGQMPILASGNSSMNVTMHSGLLGQEKSTLKWVSTKAITMPTSTLFAAVVPTIETRNATSWTINKMNIYEFSVRVPKQVAPR